MPRQDRRSFLQPTFGQLAISGSEPVVSRVDELRTVQEAWTLVQERYLDGRSALFPDAAAAWEEQFHSTQLIADMTVRLAELDGVAPAVAPDPETLSRRITKLVTDVVEPAKAEALEKVGEGRQALGIAAGWVRAKLVPRAINGGEPAAERES